MYLDRGCKCGQCCACADPCRQEMHVYRGPGQGDLLAHIQAPFLGGGLSPTLQVMDRDDNAMATVRANAVCCIGGLCCDHTFQITDADGAGIGRIVKERPDSVAQAAAELVGDSDNFTVHVPADLPADRKAAVLAAMHLIDYWLFEDEGAMDANAVETSLACKLCDLYCCGCVTYVVLSTASGDTLSLLKAFHASHLFFVWFVLFCFKYINSLSYRCSPCKCQCGGGDDGGGGDEE